MPVTNHTIAVTINGVDKTSNLLKDSVFIKLQQNSKSNVAELKFKNYDPPERATLEISINGSVVFGGYVVRKSANILGVKNSSAVIWSIECRDWGELLDTVKVTAQYVAQSDLTVLGSLFLTHLLDSNGDPIFEVGSSVTVLNSYLDISFTDVSMTEALNQLAKRVGANWYIKPNKSLYWYDKNTGTAASFGISSNPNQSTTFGFLNNSLSYEVDSSTIINQVKIIGGVTSNGEKIIESSVGNGTQKTFTIPDIPNSIAYIGWTDGIGTYTSYGSFVGYAPQDKLRSQGGNYLAVCDQNARTISIEGSTGLAPANGSGIDIHYYKKELVASEYNDLRSQSLFGIYPTSLENKEFTSYSSAEQLANQILEQNAYGRTSIKFDTTKYGLLPGNLVQIDITELEVYSGWINYLLTKEDGDNLLLENSDYILLEEYATGRTFIVQEVSLQPQITANNEYMLVCQVTAGKYTANIVDALATVSELKSSIGNAANNAIPTRLSNISSDLGEVQIGRAVFTDGGTARFQWGTPNYATGVVLGLEDRTEAQGALYIYDSGTAKVKLGKIDDMPAFGTITPSGWGIYTDNGFFKGVVSASRLIGGTVTGSLISGGTVTGNIITGGSIVGGIIDGGTIYTSLLVGGTLTAGLIESNTISGNSLSANTITGGTITGNYISGGTVTGTRITGGSIVGNTIIGGTIASGTPPINSSNPGVYFDSTGLYGYDNLGLTFRLATDPAIKPYFSSGTITEVVYEVSTNSIIRTGTSNPRVQIDNSGIFAYNSSGNLKFSVDSATGLLTANDGTFSGTVSASKFTGGTIEAGTVTGAYIEGGTVTGGRIIGGTVSASKFTGGTVESGTITGNYISAGTITGNQITGGTVSASKFTGGTVEAGTVTGAYISGGTVTGGRIIGGTVSASKFTGGTVESGTITGNYISAGTITGNQITGGTVSASKFTGGTVEAGTVTGAYISGGTVTGGRIIGGTVSASTFSGGTISSGLFTGGTVSVVSGSVLLDNEGLKFKSGTAYAYGASNNVKWINDGSVVADQASFTGNFFGQDYTRLYTSIGGIGSVDGQLSLRTYSGGSVTYSDFYMDKDQADLIVDSQQIFSAKNNRLELLRDLVPDTTADQRKLGGISNGWRYLYLADSTGIEWRLEVNTSGSLVITAA